MNVSGGVMYDYRKTMEYFIKRARKASSVIIVGASNTGRQVLKYLQNENIKVDAFYDNNEAICGQYIGGIKVLCTKKIEKVYTQTLYIIASANYKEELSKQLWKKGIPESSILFYYPEKGYDYFSVLEEDYYEVELQDMYYRMFGHYLNLEHPSTYNEKINWQKLYDKDERKIKLADKYLVREWVAEEIGEKYLTQLYGVWNDANDIDFSLLPERYVFKLNHGAGWNIIVNDSLVDEDEIRAKLNEWKQLNFAYYSFEMHYKNIVPKIICEEYLENVKDDLYDYKVFCFHGVPRYIMFLAERHTTGLKMAFYDTQWKKQPFVYTYPMYEKEVPKPINLEEMLELSSKLSKGFSHVRVDWYNLPGNKLVFGEMTFSSFSGLCKWIPEEYNHILGELM